MFYTGYTNEKTDKRFYKNLFKYVDELEPIYDSHKSFNRRAYVARDYEKRMTYLISYNTIVCGLDDNHLFFKFWDGYSATTMRHVREFMRQNSFPEGMTKKLWDAIPVSRLEV